MSPSKNCFVILPFGEKQDVDGPQIDFDEVYDYIIKPAVEHAGLNSVRCDRIGMAGSIHADMIQQIYAADVCVVDISTLNPNVFYELGVRHALRPSVTVLIRRKGTRSPFNIQGLNAIDYSPESPKSVAECKAKIADFIRAGLQSADSDSLVHDVLELSIGAGSKPAPRSKTCYRLTATPEKSICIYGGDIKSLKGVDVWVNSENTNMQMARFFDRSVSSVIRYLGAKKNHAEVVVDDTVAEALAATVGESNEVPAGSVIVTTSGQLLETHRVKKIFHVAAVTGVVGGGYGPVRNLADCVCNALDKADSARCRGDDLKSIVFPLLGAGTGGGDLASTVKVLLDAAIDYLSHNPESAIDRVGFAAWSVEEVDACRRYLDRSTAVVREGPVAQE